ncbi:protein translocase subunit SecF [Sphaerisporangium krabiense]|uniref:Protein-export membrane protein SecF n=1 Tax=Sphaerisporangium krabiense TaxID=763782 RepID=A0A7W8ZBB4_9ACTN|nr:protein translocase subunit SecF [Sphaerisporangium krabiense]MBB5630873.1 preprotein translocase subunit SecF [Sphaerisporangium krabiense]GII65443.1 protein translocase subunit SecF [Sphaerisporangium krabiense]
MSRIGVIGRRLYRGEVDIDFVGRYKLWSAVSGLLLVISIVGLVFQGLNLGVEFKGGSVFSFDKPRASTIETVRSTVEEAGAHQVSVQEAGNRWRVTTQSLAASQVTTVQNAISKEFGIAGNQVSKQIIGPTWGGEVLKKAVIGLIVFMIAIILYLTMAFEWKMALAAVVALFHDLVITAGIYAWSGFEVTPATMLGFLTILGYSLYDAVVVFDMIKEVTAKLGTTSKMTYTQAANNALNHTLIRSLNTSLVAILPVAAILFIGTTLFGAGTLKDLSLALFVGMIVGTYSSLCVATPLLVNLKEREPKYMAIAKRLASNKGGSPQDAPPAGKGKEPAAAATSTGPAASQNGSVSPQKRKKR